MDRISSKIDVDMLNVALARTSTFSEVLVQMAQLNVRSDEVWIKIASFTQCLPSYSAVAVINHRTIAVFGVGSNFKEYQRYGYLLDTETKSHRKILNDSRNFEYTCHTHT